MGFVGLVFVDRPVPTGSACLYRYVYLYIYVVAVNKAAPFLWITLVYQTESWFCRPHNRTHSVCGRERFTGITFQTLRRSPSYPVYVHIESTRVSTSLQPVIHMLAWITGIAARRCVSGFWGIS